MAVAREVLTTVMSTKGQVILPKPLRDHLRWPAGTRLTVEDTAEGVLLRPA
ncbi:AbrB/MazE/SpoVT family DNA-binding domain-containing protein, partial [Lactiplantibacillus plantarum]|nr:AbrB/MazE/SpoVT family DNA-binding domain-containing protein [Lactiplantibacillus plantarum]